MDESTPAGRGLAPVLVLPLRARDRDPGLATVIDLDLHRELRDLDLSLVRLRVMRAEIDDEIRHALELRDELTSNLERG